MPRLILLNKPFGVICQFSADTLHPTLASLLPVRGVYPAGRLDTDSEGLVLLTDDGSLQHRVADPSHKLAKIYWTQVEGIPTEAALTSLRTGICLGEHVTRPAQARIIEEPPRMWLREPPIRFRKNVPTAWLELTLREGKNRQVRRMTAKVGFPTLRLIRYAIGEWTLDGLCPGEWKEVPEVGTPGTRLAGTSDRRRVRRTRSPPRRR
jgi:23S rRNA pseudouridine2457 synthase